MGIGAAQIIRGGTGHAHRDTGLAVEFLQIHHTAGLLITDHQLRHAHIRVGKLPQAQRTRGLAQARGDVDFAFAQGALQSSQIGKIAPAQFDIKGLGQPLHQLDVGPGELLQTPVVLRVRRLQHQPDPQFIMLCQPLLLTRGQLRNVRRGRRRRPAHQGKPQTADNPQAAKSLH